MSFELPDLPFESTALEPYLSGRTIEYHHRKHLNAYLMNLNNLIKGTKFKNLDLETIIRVADGPLFYYASQVWNHTFYFECLTPGSRGSFKGSFGKAIRANFGSETFMKKSFLQAADSLFSAGWVWLVLNEKGSIEIMQKSNAGNPLRIGLFPLIACDIWEHAYYLDYQNRLDEYIDGFWKLLNWDIIDKRYNAALHKLKNSGAGNKIPFKRKIMSKNTSSDEKL